MGCGLNFRCGELVGLGKVRCVEGQLERGRGGGVGVWRGEGEEEVFEGIKRWEDGG